MLLMVFQVLWGLGWSDSPPLPTSNEEKIKTYYGPNEIFYRLRARGSTHWIGN